MEKSPLIGTQQWFVWISYPRFHFTTFSSEAWQACLGSESTNLGFFVHVSLWLKLDSKSIVLV